MVKAEEGNELYDEAWSNGIKEKLKIEDESIYFIKF